MQRALSGVVLRLQISWRNVRARIVDDLEFLGHCLPPDCNRRAVVTWRNQRATLRTLFEFLGVFPPHWTLGTEVPINAM